METVRLVSIKESKPNHHLVRVLELLRKSPVQKCIQTLTRTNENGDTLMCVEGIMLEYMMGVQEKTLDEIEFRFGAVQRMVKSELMFFGLKQHMYNGMEYCKMKYAFLYHRNVDQIINTINQLGVFCFHTLNDRSDLSFSQMADVIEGVFDFSKVAPEVNVETSSPSGDSMSREPVLSIQLA